MKKAKMEDRKIKGKKVPREEKELILVTSILTVLPMFIGLILWNRLPDRIPIHWNLSGETDGYGGKASVVFGLPVCILVMHLICVFATVQDPKSGNLVQKIRGLACWICPVISLYTAILIYSGAMGYAVDIILWICVLISGIYIVFGNYMPKCRPNNTIGIKLPWTLADEEVWTRTHRMAGPLCMVGGFVILLDVFLQWKLVCVMLVTTGVVTVVPAAYSFVLYQKREDFFRKS